MRLVDANVLLYAVNADAEHHQTSRTWLDHALRGGDTVGLTWLALIAFMRLSTKVALFPQPLTVAEATEQVGDWLAAPGARILHPTAGHLHHLERLLGLTGPGGNLVNDAHLAAIALGHRADVVSYDADFARFDGVRWFTPDQLSPRG